MPNWCKGDLKVRGSKENIEKFLLEGLQPVGVFGLSEEKPIIERDEYKLNITLEDSDFYLRGTHRQFIDSHNISFYYPEEGETTVLVLPDYKGAWGIDTDGLSKLSEEFGVDLKILGFEQGMEINQDVEIVAGKVIKDEEIHFDDYKWECIRPHIGG